MNTLQQAPLIENFLCQVCLQFIKWDVKCRFTFLYGVLTFTCGRQSMSLYQSELQVWMSPATRSLIWVTSKPLAAMGGKKKKQSKRQEVGVPHMHSLKGWASSDTECWSQKWDSESIPLRQGRGHRVSAAEPLVFFAILVSVWLIKSFWFPCGSLWWLCFPKCNMLWDLPCAFPTLTPETLQVLSVTMWH